MVATEKKTDAIKKTPKKKTSTKKPVQKAVSKSATAKRQPRSSAPRESTDTIAKTDLDRMIAEAAYYLAEKRGFSGGDPTQDWIQAERSIINQMHA